MKSIKTRLIISFSVLIVLVSVCLGFFALQRSSSAISKEAEKGLQSLAFEGARYTASRVEAQKQALKMLAGNEAIQSMDLKLQQDELQRRVEGSGFLALAVVYPDGTAYYNDGTSKALGDRDYVKKAFSGEASTSDLIISSVTNELVLMYAVPIEKDGQVVGVLVGRRDGNALSLISDETGFGEEGYGYIINSSGTVVGHPDREKVFGQFNPLTEVQNDQTLQSLAALFTKILDEKTGVSRYTFNGKNLYAGYSSIENTNWTLVITANKKEVLRAIPKLQTNILLLTLIILIISVIITYGVGHSIAKPIIRVIQHSKKIEQLDLTEDVAKDLLNKKDEIGSLAKALQSITDSLKSIIDEIARSSDQIAASSEQMAATAEQSATASEGVAKTVEQIAKGASDQAQNTEEGSSKAIVLGEIIEKDLSYMEELNKASQKVSQVVDEGLKEIENLTQISDESRKATNEVHQGIMRTNQSVNKIGEASSVITFIAGQTNLLALNAAIEAARAGEAGRGFAVVAEEIRKLAEQSNASTKTIDEVVRELQNHSNASVEIMENVASILKEQQESVETSKKKYLTIAEAMKETEKSVGQLNVSGEEMEKMKQDILSTLKNLSAIAEQNSVATQEVSAAIEEQTAASEEISSASEGLSELAQDLQSVIRKFKV
ncbi:MAG: methyl-accepting chemotaxis sensory transducer [Clostridia bacterium]|jgi:methyl-accepting chemotaxis protein|nr:methyl-accepting chemotaxis sensory transducer [Clostridia bacterium]